MNQPDQVVPATDPNDPTALAIAGLKQGVEQTERVWQVALATLKQYDEEIDELRRGVRPDLPLTRAFIELQCDAASQASEAIMQTLRGLGIDKPFGGAL